MGTRTFACRFCMGSESRGDFENILERFVEAIFFFLGSIDWIRNLQLVFQSTKVITFPLAT